MPSILIIGGGLAGLFTALKLSPLPCTVLTPVPLGEGASSAWAQGGIAAAIGEGDSIESHVVDTLAAGAGLCDAAMVRLMASEASDRILDLLEFGVPFDKDLQGKLVQSREAAHSANRIVRVKGDQAGRAIMQALIAAVRKTPSIRVIEGTEAFELLRDEHGAIAGARANLAGRVVRFSASHVVLATGGAGQLYAVTTNPKEAWGSGLAMAYRAGATLANMEFVQFHPTAIDIGRDPAPLATEALRGEGAVLVDRDGRRFMLDLHPDAELAPRDVVARGVFSAIKAGRGAFLDCRAAIGRHFSDLFPTVHASCIAAGIDPAVDLIPVAPASHYHMGGVWTDENGRALGVSAPENLFAVGEVACTGVHGANRLASNSLLEAVVFGARVALEIATKADFTQAQPVDEGIGIRPFGEDHDEMRAMLDLRRSMQADVGVLREEGGLRRAFDSFWQVLDSAPRRRVQDMAHVASLVCGAALRRNESRGGHARFDFPASWKLPLWQYDTIGTLPPAAAPGGFGPIPHGELKA
ncbi:MAG: L-aspartate oxidase [Proteobacteria bacterium]|nr:L-aspartate oxidase [Pseudomonadota bacterium]